MQARSTGSRAIRSIAALGAAAFLAVAPGLDAQQDDHPRAADGRKILTLDDYGEWRRVREVELSPDGRWLAFAYVPNDGDSELHVKALRGDDDFTATNGTSPAFSSTSGHAAFLTTPPDDDGDGGGRGNGPATRTAHWIDLGTGTRDSVPDVRSFAFAEGGRWLAVHKAKSDREAEHDGADLVLVDLARGGKRNVGNVFAFAFDSAGTRLAYLVDAADRAGNGLYLMDPATGRVTAPATGDHLYEGLAWNDAGTALAAVQGDTVPGMEQRANVLLAWTDATAAMEGANPTVYDPAQDDDFPDGFVLSELRRPAWTETGSRLVVGIKEQREALDEDEDDSEDEANVVVWHWEDDRVQSVQRVRAEADRRSTFAGVVHINDGRLVRLEDDGMPRAQVVGDGDWAIGRRDGPYRLLHDEEWGQADVVRIDTRTGARTTLAEGVRSQIGASPDGAWYLWGRDGEVMATEIASNTTTNLSERTGVDFSQDARQTPGELGTWGAGGWSEDGAWVLLNTEYDVWAVPLGSNSSSSSSSGVAGRGDVQGAYSLTGGMASRDSIRFRVVRDFAFDEDEDDPAHETVDLTEPVLLSAYGEWTKRSGWWRVEPGSDAPAPVVWEDAMYGGVERAEEADVVVYTRQTFEEFPDWWVTDTRFRRPRQVTDANPQQAEYAWGTRRLVDYVDDRGNRLQATLTLPAGYEEGERYPMLVYFYETMSQRHHSYSMPVYDDRPHMSTYASNGYLVLMPDIVYDVGRPGSSALDDLTAAVDRVIELGYADPDRIGLQGHSWGGYQSSFVVTRTDLFTAVVTGAPLTNLVSMHNILYKRTGNPNAALIQWGQGRMGVSPWDSLSLYIEESPVHQAEGITTPFLILHGTDDGAVDWNQGLEFYIAARRLGKEVILLSYPGEPHHLQEEANQKDFQRRMMQYFDHHLKGAEAPAWMTEGVDWLDRGRQGT